jgi:hypothetical protein
MKLNHKYRPALFMSFNSHRRATLDEMRPLPHRASHARSCALLVAQKYRINREAVIQRVREITGVSLLEPKSGQELLRALTLLERFRREGWESADSCTPIVIELD